MQSSETGLQLKNREFSENFRPKQAFGKLPGVGHWKFHQNSRRLAAIEQLSCYSAKQAFEPPQQAMQHSTSGFFEPQSR
jgi:hypothetical protein